PEVGHPVGEIAGREVAERAPARLHLFEEIPRLATGVEDVVVDLDTDVSAHELFEHLGDACQAATVRRLRRAVAPEADDQGSIRRLQDVSRAVVGLLDAPVERGLGFSRNGIRFQAAKRAVPGTGEREVMRRLKRARLSSPTCWGRWRDAPEGASLLFLRQRVVLAIVEG